MYIVFTVCVCARLLVKIGYFRFVVFCSKDAMRSIILCVQEFEIFCIQYWVL